MNLIMLSLNAGLVVSEKGSPDTKLSPPSSSAAMLSTVTHSGLSGLPTESSTSCAGRGAIPATRGPKISMLVRRGRSILGWPYHGWDRVHMSETVVYPL